MVLLQFSLQMMCSLSAVSGRFAPAYSILSTGVPMALCVYGLPSVLALLPVTGHTQ